MKSGEECHKKYEALKAQLDVVHTAAVQTPRIKAELIDTFTSLLN